MARFLPLSGCLLALSVLSFGAAAQSARPSPAPDAGSDNDATALAKKLQNPIGDLYSIPFQNNTNFNTGPNKGTQDNLNIQPVIPIHITEDWNVITRTILPHPYAAEAGVKDRIPSIAEVCQPELACPPCPLSDPDNRPGNDSHGR